MFPEYGAGAGIEDNDEVKQKTAYEILRSDWSSDVCSSDLKITHVFHERGRASVSVHPSPVQDRKSVV